MEFGMSMSGYVVMFRSTLDSTIWEEEPDVRLTWLTLIFLKDGEQMVRHPLRVVAKRVNLCGQREENYERVKAAMEVLMSPDTKSGDKQEFEGRRVRQVGEHFFILNGEKYDEMVKELWARARKTAKQKARRDAARNPARSGTPLPGESAFVEHGVTPHEYETEKRTESGGKDKAGGVAGKVGGGVQGNGTGQGRGQGSAGMGEDPERATEPEPDEIPLGPSDEV